MTAVCNVVIGVVGCLWAIAMFVIPSVLASGEMQEEIGQLLFVIAILVLVSSVVNVICGIGLWQMKSYGRTMQLVLAFIGLLGFPFVTIVSAFIIWYFFKPEVKVQFAA